MTSRGPFRPKTFYDSMILSFEVSSQNPYFSLFSCCQFKTGKFHSVIKFTKEHAYQDFLLLGYGHVSTSIYCLFLTANNFYSLFSDLFSSIQ